ncbi:Isopenicillin N epimerase [Phytophthora cinnamomi]|uniref:Isopenicillin N epimerase n=1 Tax=Phytophthora cinnamomi TaxID=4785 RepID=UPI00355A06D2|nr:Isopenicillin N epimerase [Phytophthora cinnamomi]
MQRMRSLASPLRAPPHVHAASRSLPHLPQFFKFIPSRSSLSTAAQKPQNRRFKSTSGMSGTPASSTGYEAFGSFHTPSTAALFAKEDDESDPAMVFASDVASQRLQLQSNSSPSAANRSLFALDLETWTYLNHGAFGAPTKVATEAADLWRARADAQPLNFNDRELFPLVVRAIKSLAGFVGVARPEKLLLLPNATAGLHSVLASVLLGDEDAGEKTVVLFSTRYGAVRKMLQAVEDSSTGKVHVHEEPLSLEESYEDQKVMERLERALDAVEDAGRCVDLVVVDHITSNTAVTMPVKDIVQRCHSRGAGVPVLVDGAHGLLNLPLDLDEVGADYYVGNCHKWFCSTRGAAFLHVAKENGPPIEPRVISHGFFDGMQSAFMWTGLQDYSSWLALPQCLAFWRRQGVDETREYMHTLVQEAAELLYSRWDMPDHLAREHKFPQHKRHGMRLVQLPTSRRLCGGVVVDEKDPNATSTDAKRVQDGLHYIHHIEVPVKCVDGRLYVRLSAHVYNCLEDFEKLAVAAVEES